MKNEKTQDNTIKGGHNFLTLHIKYVLLVVVSKEQQMPYLV